MPFRANPAKKLMKEQRQLESEVASLKPKLEQAFEKRQRIIAEVNKEYPVYEYEQWQKATAKDYAIHDEMIRNRVLTRWLIDMPDGIDHKCTVLFSKSLRDFTEDDHKYLKFYYPNCYEFKVGNDKKEGELTRRTKAIDEEISKLRRAISDKEYRIREINRIKSHYGYSF